MRDHGYACFYLFLLCLGVLSVYAYFCVSIRAHLRISGHNVDEGRTMKAVLMKAVTCYEGWEIASLKMLWIEKQCALTERALWRQAADRNITMGCSRSSNEMRKAARACWSSHVHPSLYSALKFFTVECARGRECFFVCFVNGGSLVSKLIVSFVQFKGHMMS